MAENNTTQLNTDTYEIIRGRLKTHTNTLQERIGKLNAARKNVFGALETKLIANNRILTENNCIPRDIISFDDICIFGYNVHFGLRQDISLTDVFSIYKFENNTFQVQAHDFINDPQFKTDFENLYKYYRNTFFARFGRVGNFLFMVFQISERLDDIKTFKWLIRDNQITYIDNRSDHEYKLPPQHEFLWRDIDRDMHRYGKHPHISVVDKVFVETVGGDLTIKVEDNTNDGSGIYSETVQYRDQTLDDGKVRFAEFGNLIPIEVTPFQEEPRYFIYNHKLK
ncbi:MAG: DNA repair ATPase, partial [Kangiellaceae bacterium]|nr:DNA repair ATPase [Kangiellaceae bacterium]